MERRHTIQKDLVLKAVQDMRRHVTADEVYEYVKAGHTSIGKGTVYRNLAILAGEGAIRRVEVPDGPDRFDFTLKNLFLRVYVRPAGQRLINNSKNGGKDYGS